MDDAQRLYEERQAIINAQQHVEAQPSDSGALFVQHVDTLIHTLQVGDWIVFQEYHQEQLQNAQEAELARVHEQAQPRQALER